MGPKVSIIIPTYKRTGPFLERAIESVLRQTYQNIEIVVIDDNSPDSTYRQDTEVFMARYSSEHRVVYLKNRSNLGGALARNEGIFQSQGDYVTFLDDDDIYFPDKVKKQLDFMLSNGYDMSFTNLNLYNPEGRLIDYREYPFISDFANASLLKHHLMRHITGTSTFMYKREALVRIGGFTKVPVGQEFHLMLKTIESNFKIGYLPLADVGNYVHPGERISTGLNKLEGEKRLFQFKKQYFDRFTIRERMFIRFRYHVVMAVAGLRSKLPLVLVKHGLVAILSSPFDAVIEPIRFVKKLAVQKKKRAAV